MSYWPNVLLIHSDQHRFDCVGANQRWCADGPGRLALTPNLDGLAKGGATFAHGVQQLAQSCSHRSPIIGHPPTPPNRRPRGPGGWRVPADAQH